MLLMWLFDTDWKAELFKRLDALAEKMGVAANHLWAVLVRQGVATGVADAVVAVVIIALTLVSGYFARKLWKKAAVNDSEDYGAGAAGLWVLAAVLFGIAMVYAYDATLELINPEYYALQKVLELLK